jgi:hypothetical protein
MTRPALSESLEGPGGLQRWIPGGLHNLPVDPWRLIPMTSSVIFLLFLLLFFLLNTYHIVTNATEDICLVEYFVSGTVLTANTSSQSLPHSWIQ